MSNLFSRSFIMRNSNIRMAVLVGLSLTAQGIANGQSDAETTLNDFVEQYRSLQGLSNDEARLAASEALQTSMVAYWSVEPMDPAVFAPLSKSMGFAHAGEGDERFVVISWNVELRSQSQAYGGLMVFIDRKGAQRVEPLQFKKPTSLRASLDEKARFTSKDWPGAVYYEALLRHQGNKPVYTLLGWDGADNIRTRKIIETVSLSGSKMKFGIPILSVDRGTTKRHILEYSDQVSAMLKWRPDMEMIVMDHLSPPRPELVGQTSYYGPDMSYDGFAWKKNRWVLEQDIDLRDPDVSGPWNNPKKLRRRRRN